MRKAEARAFALGAAISLLQVNLDSGTFNYMDDPEGHSLTEDDVEKVNKEMRGVINGLTKLVARLERYDHE